MNPNRSTELKIAFIISPHGFGHAARACAVMEAIGKKYPAVEFDVISLVPEWFFQQSLPGGMEYFPFDADVGVVQVTPFIEDLPATVERLKTMLPFQGERIKFLAQHLINTDAALVICDIAPMGIAAAKVAGIPSVLIENFTWDWIYEGYLEQEPRLGSYLEDLEVTFNSADFHIQTQPICWSRECDLNVFPTARTPRMTGLQVRSLLGIDPGSALILVTMGGIEQGYPALKRLSEFKNVTFIIPGSSETYSRHDNLVLLPHQSVYYHPDLVNACDAVVGKLGYSTIAEAYHAGVPYGYVPRNHFRETTPLAEFVKKYMGGVEISDNHFVNGEWVGQIDDLLSKPRQFRNEPNGADQIADFLVKKMEIPLPTL
jgi:hypothetical protein